MFHTAHFSVKSDSKQVCFLVTLLGWRRTFPLHGWYRLSLFFQKSWQPLRVPRASTEKARQEPDLFSYCATYWTLLELKLSKLRKKYLFLVYLYNFSIPNACWKGHIQVAQYNFYWTSVGYDSHCFITTFGYRREC